MAAFLPMMVFIGTSMAFYTFCSPSFIHAADSFLLAAAFYFAVMPRPVSVTKSRIRNLLIGFLLALSLLLRNNNIVLIPVIVGGVLFFERKDGWKRALVTCVEIFLGALPVLILHAHYNWTQYGRFFATGYRVDLSEQGLTSKFQFLKRFDKILIHPSAGMFVWAPITLLASIGLTAGTIDLVRCPQ